MLRKAFAGIVSGALIALVVTASVLAYIDFNPNGPDILANPGYRWNVHADAAANESVCIQWSIGAGNAWDHNRCVRSAPAGGAWACTIPHDFPDTTIAYQFYKSASVDNCDPATSNTWEWTLVYSFDTVPDSVTLNRLRADSAIVITGWLGVTLVLGGAIVVAHQNASAHRNASAHQNASAHRMYS
ncbi:MAG: hypothetical protein JXB35_17435 [Anaerolineae bacterium]|nr:hypothetical protein [Anaerolineae bacterium]